jgi:hypothetical protein
MRDDDLDNTKTHRLLSMRVPQTLYDAIELDAVALGTSLSDAARFRLRTGSCPTIDSARKEKS